MAKIFYLLKQNKKFSPNANLKALHIRFLPDQEQETNISSREFIKKAEFVNAEAFAEALKEDKPQSGGGSPTTGGGSNTGGGSGDNPGEGD